jgi:hypothetical protein
MVRRVLGFILGMNSNRSGWVLSSCGSYIDAPINANIHSTYSNYNVPAYTTFPIHTKPQTPNRPSVETLKASRQRWETFSPACRRILTRSGTMKDTDMVHHPPAQTTATRSTYTISPSIHNPCPHHSPRLHYRGNGERHDGGESALYQRHSHRH